MEEKKNTTVFEMMWTNIIELEEMVNRIYYIGQIEDAERFEKRVSDLKNNFLSKIDSDKNEVLYGDFDDIIIEPTELKEEINKYFAGSEIENKKIRERYIKKTEEISLMTEKTSTAESWECLRKIVEDWKNDCKKHPHFEVKDLDINQIISKAVLSILESQAKNGEKVDLKPVDEVCSRSDLVYAVRKKFIQMAKETEDLDKRDELLDTAKYLTVKRLSDSKVWEQLVGINSVKIKNEQETAKIESKKINNPEATESFKISKCKTIYTFGDIDPDTGKWINVEEVSARYPQILSRKKSDRLLKIEIHGVEKVKRRNFRKLSVYLDLPKYDNLQEVVFGDDVKEIEPFTFEGYSSLKKVKIGEGITNIPECCFSLTGLKSVEIPGNVNTICKDAFYRCEDLRNVIVNNGVKRIQESAFSVGKGTFCQNIVLPETIEILNSRFIVFHNFDVAEARRFEVEIAGGIKIKISDYLALFQEGELNKGKLKGLIEGTEKKGNLTRDEINSIAKQKAVAMEDVNSDKIMKEIAINKENQDLNSKKMEGLND